ncbi:MAG: DUF4185 domain-containing protein [Clostridia bacterium]|nr:DUF4185 domain-containing protein [Clostridia bacterium]
MVRKSLACLLCFILLLGAAIGKAEVMEDHFALIGSELPEAVIVYPSKSNVKALMKALATEIADYAEAKTGIKIQVITDDKMVENAVEITVGSVNREEAQEAQAQLPENGYRIARTSSGGVMILGAEQYALTHAVDLFIAEELLVNADGALFIDDALDRSGTLMLSDWEKDGANIGNRQRMSVIKGVKGESAVSSLKSISGIHTIMQLAGEYSINRTRSRWNVATADIGCMCLHNGKLYFFFGDTLGGARGQDWLYSNVVAYSTDFDYTNGIRFDGYLTGEKGRVAPVLQGAFGAQGRPNEYTCIPTGAISLNGALYMCFMSVALWQGDDWDCNCGGIMKSTDDGVTWQRLEISWPGDSKFCQMAPVYNEADGYVYVTGITGGRLNSARMMRVPADQYEVFDAYEYLVGYDGNGQPLWKSGEEGLYNDFELIRGRVWEPCMMYNEYLGEWIVSYKDAAGIQLYTAYSPAGPYMRAASIPYAHDSSAGYYAVFMHPALTREGGRKVAFLISSMHNTPAYPAKSIWEIQLMEMTLNK